ncbi:MAG: hypothetical protein Q8K25_04160, partial [Hydrogenophaga sp.]|nr:hypothetical protein [Hydrogenophaga sp.]
GHTCALHNGHPRFDSKEDQSSPPTAAGDYVRLDADTRFTRKPTAVHTGRLVSVLDDFAAPPNGIFALFPQRKHLALRVRLWIDFLKHEYARPEFWKD